MSIRNVLRKFKKNSLILWLWNEYRRLKGIYQLRQITDFEFVKSKYVNSTGNSLNLSTPTRFTEKLQWLKLFYRDSKIEICSDKYTAREYVKEQGYEFILNKLIASYNSVDEIDFDSLPEQFVLKVSHGSGWNIVCKDKKKINWRIYKLIIKSWMKQNLYIYGREWNYEHLEPKIIIEKYIDSGDGQLTDYKFFCFNGEPKFVQVDRDRFKKHKQTYYDMRWEKLPFTTGHIAVDEVCPEKFEEMKKIASELSIPFPHVRIDFYNVKGKIYFGEFTYFDGSGFYNYKPDEWDYHWGKELQLPQPNYNLELYDFVCKQGET